MSTRLNRRGFLGSLAIGMGGVALAPIVASCSKSKPAPGPSGPTPVSSSDGETGGIPEVPVTRPDDWDPIAFNKSRGNAGAIPDSYREAINGAEGDSKHLGKHLPYKPSADETVVDEGKIALMWGDPEKGHALHPNAPRTDANPEGHWYNWIRIRKAVDGEAEEVESNFSNWPETEAGDSGAYAVKGGGDIEEDSGKNTIYIAALPTDVSPGDTIRIWCHCLTHGEYVDFITL